MTTAVRERNRKRLKRVMLDTRTKMYTGRLVNGVASTAGAPTNKTWVRYPANSTEETLAWGNVLRPDVPVWVQKNKLGQNEIVGVEYVEGTVKWDNALETVGARPIINEIQPTSVGEFGILPGRIGASPLGSTYIRIQAFEHRGGRYPTKDVDVGDEYPTLDGAYRRIGVYVDPNTNTETVFGGEEVFDRNDFTDADKLSVPDNMYPVGAVIVYDDNDISSANTFEDWRLHHSSKGSGAASGLPAFGSQEVVTIASGVLDLSGATGRNIVVAAESGTSDTVDSITGLGDGEAAVFQADTGDAIAFAHNAGVLNLYNGTNIALSGSDLLLLVGRGGGEVTQPVDEKGGTGGGGSVSLLLDYTNNSVGINGTAVTATNTLDIFANQSFTVASSGSGIVEFSMRGVVLANSSGSQVGTRLVIDSAGTPLNVPLGGGTPTSNFPNVLAGSAPVKVSGLSVGSHTVKLQVLNAAGASIAVYCRSLASEAEYVGLQVTQLP